jgi:plastocyanin
MRKLILLLTAIAAVAAFAAPATAATSTVQIVRTGFVPATTTIENGDTVTWHNADSRSHQVVADNGSFVSPELAPGENYSFTFKASGTYRYRDVFDTRERGTITVRGVAPTVSIATTSPILTFGGSSHVTGRVSSGKAGETVRILSRPYPQSSFVVAADVVTTTGGVYDYVTGPTILTSFQATWKSTSSIEVRTEIRPRVSLHYNRTTRVFTTRVTYGRPAAGKTVHMQRFSPLTGRWVTIRRVVLNNLGSRQFRLTLPKGVSRVRAYMTINQAGPGYLDGWSGTWAITR